MYYSLVHFPEVDRGKINGFRKKYDPYFELIDAHFSIIFPVPDSVNMEQIVGHIQNILLDRKPFAVQASGFEKSWDNWLFLVLKDGKDEMIKLHDALYGGLLEPFWRKDIEYVPHVALGLFTKKEAGYDLKNPEVVSFDEDSYNQALKEAEELDLGFRVEVNKLSLVEVNNDFTKTTLIKEFTLGN